jgi:hypothetical protein
MLTAFPLRSTAVQRAGAGHAIAVKEPAASTL